MSVAKLATDLPLWPEAPFRGRIASRFEIRKGEFQGREIVVVWDPKHQMQASGYLNEQGTWDEESLVGVMKNLCGATFLTKHGFDALTRVLAAKKVNPRALSPEARELIEQYDKIYAWEATPPALNTGTTPVQASAGP